ncbi:hypothetical protein HPB49_022478 [Dermacentor silvarum]|uniref:Uncharacterized protein n=1 Tax=Dermacentor silvarum TaxID=543639 RepID=A0ACB8CHK2_DERSI|nr:hypothetical protein HPB49_022478 [Dermacentor silvarum]
MKQVPVYNRYAILASLEEDASQVTAASTATSDAAKPTYGAAVRASISRPQRQRASQSIEDTPPPLANEEFQIDARLATLEKVIQRLKERRTLLQRRHDGARASRSTLTSIPAHVVNPASMSQSFSPQELLRFVAQQLQHLTSILVATSTCDGCYVFKCARRHFTVDCPGIAGRSETCASVSDGKLRVWALLLQETKPLPPISGFVAYSSPSMLDRRSATPDVLQERLPFMYDSPFIRPVLIFHGGALYGKKSSLYWFVSNAQTLSSFRTMHAPTVVVRLGCVSAGWCTYDRNILVAPLGGSRGFNAPHTTSRYASSSARGTFVLGTFMDAQFTLLIMCQCLLVGGTTLARRHLPDLSWWLGRTTVSWSCEPDCGEVTTIRFTLAYLRAEQAAFAGCAE